MSELASWALQRAAEGVAVTAICGRGWLRLEATTRGGWWPAGRWCADGTDGGVYACAMVVIDAVADRFGHRGTTGGPAVLWAELGWGGVAGGRR